MREDLLRFDGLYQAGDGENNNFIRFFPDGLVIDVVSTGTAAQVGRWLNRTRARSKQAIPSSGEYHRQGNTISFITYSLYSEVEYQGIIKIDHLQLQIYSHTTDYRETREYNFVACDFDRLEREWLELRTGEKFRGTKNDFRNLTYSGFGLSQLCEPDFTIDELKEKLIDFARLGLTTEFYEVIEDCAFRISNRNGNPEISELPSIESREIRAVWRRAFENNPIGKLYGTDVQWLSGRAKRANIFLPGYRGRTKKFLMTTDADNVYQLKKVIGIETALNNLTLNQAQIAAFDYLKNVLLTAQKYRFLFVIV